MFRAFYKPKDGDYNETFVDATTLEALPSGAILVIKMNEDGTREIIQDEAKQRPLTPKEQEFHKYAERHLEYKHDGGDTPEMRSKRSLKGS